MLVSEALEYTLAAELLFCSVLCGGLYERSGQSFAGGGVEDSNFKDLSPAAGNTNISVGLRLIGVFLYQWIPNMIKAVDMYVCVYVCACKLRSRVINVHYAYYRRHIRFTI